MLVRRHLLRRRLFADTLKPGDARAATRHDRSEIFTGSVSA